MHVHHVDSTARRRLLATLIVTAAIMVAELVGGWLSGSLALLADAGHMLTDLLALTVAYAAMSFSMKPADTKRTYGYRRLEVIAAFLNSIALVIISFSIVIAALYRFLHPDPLDAKTMLQVAGIGFLANLVGLGLLGHGHDNLNVRGAFLHLLGDALSSLAVIVGGAIIMCTGWVAIDPLLSIGISIIIVVSSFSLLKEVVDVLLEAAPKGIDTEQVRQAMTRVKGVQGIHDLHIWSITSGVPALSAHVVVTHPETNGQRILAAMQACLRDEYAIEHATLQIEPAGISPCGCASSILGHLEPHP